MSTCVVCPTPASSNHFDTESFVALCPLQTELSDVWTAHKFQQECSEGKKELTLADLAADEMDTCR